MFGENRFSKEAGMEKKINGVFQSKQPQKAPIKGMKKVLVLLALAIAATVVHAIISFLAMLLFLRLLIIAILPAGMLVIGFVVLILAARKKAEEKFSIHTPAIFLVCGGVPLLSSGAYYFSVTKMLENKSFGDEMFAGLFEACFSISLCICSLITVVILIFIVLLEAIKRSKKSDI